MGGTTGCCVPPERAAADAGPHTTAEHDVVESPCRSNEQKRRERHGKRRERQVELCVGLCSLCSELADPEAQGTPNPPVMRPAADLAISTSRVAASSRLASCDPAPSPLAALQMGHCKLQWGILHHVVVHSFNKQTSLSLHQTES